MPLSIWSIAMLLIQAAPSLIPLPDPLPTQARSADAFVNSIGVNVHLSYFQTPYGKGWDDIVKPKLIASGIRHIRDGATVLPDDKWMQIVYGRMNELAARGIHADLVIRLADQNVQATLDGWDRLLQFALPAAEAFEGLNEHDISRRGNWAPEVQQSQQELYAKVKGDPRTKDMPVYGPSMGRARNALALGDLGAFMDYGNTHPYPGGLVPMSNLSDHESKVKTLIGGKPMVVTETGYHTALEWTGEHPPVTEEAMGRYMPRLLLDYFDAGISRTYIYEFIDEGTSLSNREQAFGLLRADGSEKPAFTAVKNLISILADPGAGFSAGRLNYTVAGDMGGVKTMLLQKRDGRYYLIFWQEAPSYDIKTRLASFVPDRQMTLTLPTAAQLKVYQPLKSAAPLSQSTGKSLQMEIPDSPLIVEISP